MDEVPLRPWRNKWWLSRSDWPIGSSDRLYLIEAVEVAGKAILGAEWTGEEMGAMLIGPVPSDAKALILRLLAEYDPDHNPMAEYTVGHWHHAREIAERLDKEASPVVERLTRVQRALLSQFRDYNIRTYSQRTGGGEPRDMSSKEWWSDDWAEHFRFGSFREGHFRELHSIFVDREDLETFLVGQQGSLSPLSERPDMPEVSPSPAPKPVKDWAQLPATRDAAWQLSRLHGLDDTLDHRAVALLLLWVSNGWGKGLMYNSARSYCVQWPSRPKA